MDTILILCGLYNLGFALFHMLFWKLFRWDEDLKKISFVNSRIMQILNIQIIFYFVFVAVLCFIFPSEIVSTTLGKYFLAGTSLFWLIRTFQQFIFFKTNNLKINILTVLFITGTILFALPILF
ncbi:MAG TPA: hypothetical protein DCM02_01390 [Flavobacterium sp.]|nr:hypothetical protein [Flavobacterium sp.]